MDGYDPHPLSEIRESIIDPTVIFHRQKRFFAAQTKHNNKTHLTALYSWQPGWAVTRTKTVIHSLPNYFVGIIQRLQLISSTYYGP